MHGNLNRIHAKYKINIVFAIRNVLHASDRVMASGRIRVKALINRFADNEYYRVCGCDYTR